MLKKENGHTIEFIPIKNKCTYHYPTEGKPCKNCNDTMIYISGYYLIIDGKYGYTVDSPGK